MLTYESATGSSSRASVARADGIMLNVIKRTSKGSILSKNFKKHKKIKIAIKNGMDMVRKMVLKAETKIRIRGRKEYKYFYVHLPSKVAEDSQFPFKEGEIVVVEIVEGEKKLCIHKREERKDGGYLSVTWQSDTED